MDGVAAAVGPVEVVGTQPDAGQVRAEEAQAARGDGVQQEAQPVLGDTARVAEGDGDVEAVDDVVREARGGAAGRGLPGVVGVVAEQGGELARREGGRVAAGGAVGHPVEAAARLEEFGGEAGQGGAEAERHVGGDLTDAPARAQGGGVPLRGGEGVEYVGQLAAFGGCGTEDGGGRGGGRAHGSRVGGRAAIRPRVDPSAI